MSKRFLVALRRALTTGPAVVLVPSLVAGTLVAASGDASEERPKTSTVATTPGGGQFVPLKPARIADTNTTSNLTAGQTRTFPVLGLGGVPTTGVSAVVVVVTGIAPTTASYLTVWPSGVTRPGVSQVNFTAGESAANTVIVKLGTDGMFNVYNKSGTTRVLLDVNGYYTSSSTTTAGGTFVPLSPARIYSTPDGLNTGSHGTATMSAQQTRTVRLTELGGVPANAAAVAINLRGTTTTSTAAYLSVWEAGLTRPTASNVQLAGNDTQTGLAVVKVDASGDIALYNSAGTTEVMIDVEGYYLPPTSDAANYYVPITPARILYTGSGLGTGGSTDPLGPGATMSVTVRGAADATGTVVVPPVGVQAVVASIGISSPTAASYLTAWTNGESRPSTSMAVWNVGESRTATFFGKIGETGKIDLYNSAGTAVVVVDVQGYFMDDTIVPPAAPTNLTGTAEDGAVALTWTAADDNGNMLWGNTVTATTAAGVVVSTANVSSGAVAHTVTGLSNGQAYTFSVAATNEGGTGPAATTPQITPRGVPSAPTDVLAVAGNRSVTATWTAATPNGSAITGQAVTVRRADTSAQVAQELVGATVTSRSIAGLTNGTAYYVDVTATNVAGTGQPGRSANVTPVDPAPGSYASTVVADGPSVYYRLGETSGTIAQDASGYDRDATYATATLGEPGVLVGNADKAIAVSNGGRVQYASAEGLPVGNAARTIEAWVKTASTSEQHIAGWGSDTTNNRSFLWMSNGNRVTFERWGSALRVDFTNTKYLADNRWHHIVLTYSGAPSNTATLFLDGALVEAKPVSGGVDTQTTAAGLMIGREPNCDCGRFTGRLDEVAVYPAALSAAQVLGHFTASGNYAPLAPPNFTAVALDGKNYLTADWDSATGGVPQGFTGVDRYIATVVTPLGVKRGRIMTSATVTDARVSGLAAGDYRVEVQGCNGWGCGAPATTVVTVTGEATTYVSEVLADGPLAYYRLGERSGTVAADSSAYSRDADYQTNSRFGANGAIGADPDPSITGTGAGATALVSSSAADFLPDGAESRTLEAWVKGNGAVASWGTSSTGRAFGIRVNGTSFVVTGYSNDVSFTLASSVADGNWHHVVATFDGANVRAYFDGAPIGTGTFPTALNTALGKLLIGYVPGDSAARSAAVDDVAVYATALTPERVKKHFDDATAFPKAAATLPGTPTYPRVIANATSATVTWTAPGDTSVLDRFDITMRRRDSGEIVQVLTAPANATSVTFDPLPTASSFLFDVRAVNILGSGPTSPRALGTTIPPLANGLPPGPSGPTQPGERITSNTTWGPDHSPYIVFDLYIEPNATLTILPGTVVKAKGQINVKGQLVAVGTAGKPVVFTSWQDDSVGGDSNGDGSATTPGAGNWARMKFTQLGNTAPRVSVLDHVEIKYGGWNTGYATVTEGVIETDGFAKLVLSNSRLDSNISGVGTSSADPSGTGWTSITNNVFTEYTYGVRPNVRTEIIGNVFAAPSNPAKESIGLRFNVWAKDVLVAYNDLHTEVEVNGSLADDTLVVTRNNFWQRFDEMADWYFPVLKENYWGGEVDAPGVECMTSAEANEAWPPLIRGYIPGVSCPPLEEPTVDYKWLVRPMLQAPVSTWEMAAASDDAVPTVGPVDTARGILRYEATDIELTDAGEPLALKRMYRSDRGDGVLGKGWSTNYSAAMKTAPNGTKAVDFASGTSLRFQPTGAAEAGVPALLSAVSNATTISTPDNSSYEFDAAGQLTAMTARDPGRRVSLTREGDRLTAVTGVSGRRITFGYSGGVLSSAGDSAGRSLAYAVTGGLLTSAGRVEGGAEAYGYDASGRLTSVTTPMGRTVLSVGYDASGRVAWYEEGGAGRTTLEYHPEESYTIVHQPDGVDIRQEYDRFHRLIRQVIVGGRTSHVAMSVGSVPAVTVTGVPAEGSTGAPEVVATRTDLFGGPTEEVDGTGRWVRTTFDSAGRPLVTTYPDSGKIVRQYNASGRLVSLTDPMEKVWTAEYDAFGQVTKITDPLSRFERRTYHANGDLHESFDVGNLKTTFTIDAVGRLTGVTDPLGLTTSTTFTPWNAVASQTTPRGAVTSTTFDADRNPLVVAAPMQRTTSMTYDTFGRLKTVTSGEDALSTLFYDPMSRVEKVVGPRNATFIRTFTANGDVKDATDAMLKTTKYTYDSVGNVATITDPTDVVTKYVHDQAGRLVSQQVGAQAAEVRTYDAKGRLWKVKSPFGGEVTTTYDKLDRPVSMFDTGRAATVTSRTFDNAGRLASETSALGNTTTFGYDASDRLDSADDEAVRDITDGPAPSDPDYHNVFFRVFDDGGRLISETNGRGEVTSYTYDDDGHVATVSAPDTGVTRYETDLAGRVTAVIHADTDPSARRTEIDYDRADRVTERRYADLTNETFAYDAAGNLELHVDRTLHSWAATYDLANRRRTATSPELGVEEFEYDAAGRPTKYIDADDVVTTTTYDSSGRVSRTEDGALKAWVTTYPDAQTVVTTDPDGVVAKSRYDGAGRVVSVFDTLNAETTFAYDAADHVTKETDPLTHATTSEYDVRGRLTATVNAKLERTAHTYNLADSLASTMLPDLSKTTYEYDGANRLAKVTDADLKAFDTTYNAFGERATLTLPRGGIWKWTYDRAGHLDTEETPTHEITDLDHDAEGRLKKIQRPSGRVTSFTLDKEGRVTREQGLDGTWRARTYTPAGRLKTATSAAGTTQWNYDPVLGLLVDTVDAGGTSTTTYTAAHRVRTQSVHGASTTTASYNSRGLLASLSGAINQSYEYDTAQRLSTIRYASPETGVETFTWDDADRLLSREQRTSAGATTAQVRLAYEYDGNGRVKRAIQSAPARSVDTDASFLYDNVGRLKTTTTTSGGVATTVGYGWDADSNRNAVTTTVGAGAASTVSYTFDLTGRMTAGSDGSAMTYDADGNVIASSGDRGLTYTYDGLGALTGAAVPAESLAVSYARDGLGRMVGRTAGGATSSFSYSGTSLDLVEQRTGADVTALLRQPDGMLAGVAAGSSVSHALLTPHADLSGLVSASSGSLSAFAAYDPFGTRTGDTAALPVGFQSDFTDAVTGFVDMGARSYSPASGRFMALDDVVGDALRPVTLNRYLYGNADPLAFVDPDGHSSCGLTDPIQCLRDGANFVRSRLRDLRATVSRVSLAASRAVMARVDRSLDLLTGTMRAGWQATTRVAGAVMTEVKDGLAQVRADLRAHPFARLAASTVVGVVVSGACGLTTFGAGSLMCLTLGEAAGSAVDAYLTCPPERSGGECAAAGALSGMASGAVFGLAGRSYVGKVAVGALAGAAGSVVGQLAMNGEVDRGQVGQAALAGAAVAGISAAPALVPNALRTPQGLTRAPNAPQVSGRRTVEQAGIARSDALRIQKAANRTRQRITVVGSRAEGTAGPLSDWDYIFSGPSHARQSAKSSVPRGKAGGELDFGTETGIDRWQDYNPTGPGYNPLDSSRPHVIFDPQGGGP